MNAPTLTPSGATTAPRDVRRATDDGPAAESRAGYYSRHAASLRAELGRAIPRDVLRDLHAKSPARHLLGTARQFGLLAVCSWGLATITPPFVWIPLALVQGFTVFNFTVLLHEVVHHAVFSRRRPVLERALSFLYAVPSGISSTQFGRWHLDHHAELGSDEADPKRHHLSPKRNARWFKLLYATPALFPIYFRAARNESATYPADVRRTIRRERWVAMAAHLGALGVAWWWLGAAGAVRVYVVPVFFVFPVAFMLNRLGQHYDIDPGDVAKWGTLMRSHWFWNLAFLNSNLHLEHHYFPGVPYYRLPALQRALLPFYASRGMRWQTYRGLLHGWFVLNRVPHTDWH
jgi:fatty acid desaturase